MTNTEILTSGLLDTVTSVVDNSFIIPSTTSTLKRRRIEDDVNVGVEKHVRLADNPVMRLNIMNLTEESFSECRKTIDTPIRFSVIDTIMKFRDCSRTSAKKQCNQLKSSINTTSLQFPGNNIVSLIEIDVFNTGINQRMTPVATFPELLVILSKLPGQEARVLANEQAEIASRVVAGDENVILAAIHQYHKWTPLQKGMFMGHIPEYKTQTNLVTQLKGQITQNAITINTNATELVKTKNELDDTKLELSEKKVDLVAKDQRIGALETDVKTTNTKLEKLLPCFKSMEKQFVNVIKGVLNDPDLDSCKKHKDALKNKTARIRELNADIVAHKNTITSLETTHKNIITAVDATIESLKVDANNANCEVAHLDYELNAVKQQHAASLARINALEAELMSYENATRSIRIAMAPLK